MSKHEIKKTKKKFKILIGIIVIFIVICSSIFIVKYDVINKVKQSINPILIEDIKISLDKIYLEIGEEIEIKTDIFPKEYTKSFLEWNCTNKDIVYLNDPSAGENVKQSKSKFISNWKKLY